MASGILIVVGVHCDKACKEDSKVGQRRFPGLKNPRAGQSGMGPSRGLYRRRQGHDFPKDKFKIIKKFDPQKRRTP